MTKRLAGVLHQFFEYANIQHEKKKLKDYGGFDKTALFDCIDLLIKHYAFIEKLTP